MISSQIQISPQFCEHLKTNKKVRQKEQKEKGKNITNSPRFVTFVSHRATYMLGFAFRFLNEVIDKALQLLDLIPSPHLDVPGVHLHA